jgi:rhodanese-related sulfurtransferase
MSIQTQVQNTQKAIEYFENKLEFTLGPVGLKHRMEKGDINLIDVRRPEDYEKGHLPGAISAPQYEIEKHLGKLTKEKPNVLYCYTQQCHMAAKAALTVAKHGYPVMELEGGIAEWRDTYKYDIVTD